MDGQKYKEMMLVCREKPVLIFAMTRQKTLAWRI